MEENVKNNIYAKINVVRLELSKEMNKSGKNSYSKYDYFQLKDFMPKAIELCNENGLFTKFWIAKEKQELPTKVVENTNFNESGEVVSKIVNREENFQYVEKAYLLVIDVETGEEELFEKETANVSVQAAQAIQNLGAKSTYMKRYMYMDVFEINENDMVEENTEKPAPKVETKTTKAASKPVVKAVETKTTAPVVEAPVEHQVTVDEAIEQVNAEDLMSMETKLMIASKIKEAGLDPRTQIVEFAKELGTDVPLLKESDKDAILEIIDKKVGGN